jgi:plastocyanin
MRRVRRHSAVVVLAVLVLGLVAAGCSSNDDTGGGGGGGVALTAKDFEFSPTSITTGADGKITVTNDGSVEHSFTMDDGSVDQDVEPGESVTVTVTTSGGFHCKYHPTQMTGSVTVGS